MAEGGSDNLERIKKIIQGKTGEITEKVGKFIDSPGIIKPHGLRKAREKGFVVIANRVVLPGDKFSLGTIPSIASNPDINSDLPPPSLQIEVPLREDYSTVVRIFFPKGHPNRVIGPENDPHEYEIRSAGGIITTFPTYNSLVAGEYGIGSGGATSNFIHEFKPFSYATTIPYKGYSDELKKDEFLAKFLDVPISAKANKEIFNKILTSTKNAIDLNPDIKVHEIIAEALGNLMVSKTKTGVEYENLDSLLQQASSGLISTDSSSISTFTTAIFRALGIPARRIEGTLTNLLNPKDTGSTHFWTEIYDPESKSWVMIDPLLNNFKDRSHLRYYIRGFIYANLQAEMSVSFAERKKSP